MKKLSLIVITSILSSSAIATVGNWSLGAGALLSANPYESMDTNVLAIPFLSYQSKYFAIYGPAAKIRYPLNENHTVGIRFNLGMQEFNPSDTSSIAMQSLNERKRLFFIGPHYRYRGDYGQVTTGVSYDVSDRSKGGVTADINYGYPIKAFQYKTFLRPSIGLNYSNGKLANHYYQISQSESINSGLSAYQADNFISPYAALFASIHLTKKIFFTNVVRVNYLPNTVTNSPMVAKDVTYTLISGLTYEFGDKKQRFNH